MDNFREKLMEGLKKAKKTVTTILKKPLKKLMIVGVVMAIIIVSLVSSYDALMDQFSKRTGEHMKKNPVKYNATDDSILIEEEQVAILEKMLADLGTSKEKIHLTTEDLKKIYAAEVVTQEINRGTPEVQDKYYGRVYVKKVKDSTENLEDLIYIPFDQFQALGADEILKYFSIDGDKLCIASTKTTTDEQGNATQQVNIQKLNYKNQLLPYIMPVEFLLDLAIITENPEFVRALADKVINETRIVIGVMDEQEEKITTTTRTYKIETETIDRDMYYTSDGEYIKTEDSEPVSSVGEEQTETETTTQTTITPVVKIISIDTWFISQKYTYNQVVNTTTTEIGDTEPSNQIPDEEKGQFDFVFVNRIEEPDGSIIRHYEGTRTRKVEQKQSVQITTNHTTYQQGIIKEPEDKTEELIKMLKTPYKLPQSYRKEAPLGDIVNGAGILLQMLQNNERTQAVEHIMRYVLYLCTGKNYGVTELDLSLFEPNGGFDTISNSSLSGYLRQFSHSTQAPQSADGKYYLMYGDGVGWPTIGNADIQWKSHHSKFNEPGRVLKDGEETTVTSVEEYVNSFLTRGAEAEYTNDEVYQMQIYVEKELVDKIGDEIQKTYYDSVINATSGLNLSRQQLYALTTIIYNFGYLPTRNGYTFKQVYEAGAGQYEINSWEHNRFIWDNWWCALGGGAAGHIPMRDAAFETYVKGIYDFSQSSAGPVFGRSCYIYYTQEQLNRFDYAPNKPITRTTSNEPQIFKYEENSSGTNGVVDIDGLELSTYTNKAGKTFTEYKQNVGPWASMPYGSDGTIKSQGCSVTCLAIMTSGYGYDFTPAKWAGKSLISMSGQASQYARGSTRISIGEEKHANTIVASTNKKDIQDHLKTGDVVIIHVLGSKHGYNNPYTSNQHWMVLLDINDSADEVYVSNPWSGKSNGWENIDEVLKSLCCYIKVSQ